MLAIEKTFLHQLTVLWDHCLHTRDVCKRCMVCTTPCPRVLTAAIRRVPSANPAADVPHISSPFGAANWTTASLMLALSVAHDIKSQPSLRLSCCTDCSNAQWFLYAVLDEGLTFRPGCGCFTCPSRICMVAKNVKNEQHWSLYLTSHFDRRIWDRKVASQLSSDLCSS